MSMPLHIDRSGPFAPSLRDRGAGGGPGRAAGQDMGDTLPEQPFCGGAPCGRWSVAVSASALTAERNRPQGVRRLPPPWGTFCVPLPQLDSLESDLARFDFVRDILDGCFSVGAWRISPATCIPGRAHATRIGLPQLPYQQTAKIDPAFLPAHGLEAHRISHKRFAHKALSSSPLDLTVAPDPTHCPLPGILQDPTPGSLCPGTIYLRRWPLPQSLVRANVVVTVYPSIRAALLCTPVARARPSCFGLHHSMHLLVPSVLFGMARSDELHANSQRRPPGAQARKPRRTRRSKGTAVVHANDQRIAVLSEQPQKNAPHWLPPLIGQQPDAQQIAAEQIPHRQRLRPTTVLSAKPSFEIHRPYVVASTRQGQGSKAPLRAWTRTPTNPGTEFHCFQPPANRARGRRTLTGVVLDQSNPQFATSPTAMPSPQTPNSGHPWPTGLLRRVMRTTPPIVETALPFLLEALLPFVAALSAEPERPTQPRHALLGLQSQLHELQSSRHQGDCLP